MGNELSDTSTLLVFFAEKKLLSLGDGFIKDNSQ